jgi:hypothetical protein
VSIRVEDGPRLPALWAGHPCNNSGVARLQGVEGLGMVDPCETLGSPLPPLAMRPWKVPDDCFVRTRGGASNQLVIREDEFAPWILDLTTSSVQG